MEDFNRKRLEQAMKMIHKLPQDSEPAARFLYVLGIHLQERSKSSLDIELAIQGIEWAIHILGGDHFEIGELYTRLGILVGYKYQLPNNVAPPKQGDAEREVHVENISKDIGRLADALEKIPVDPDLRPEFLCMLGLLLYDRSQEGDVSSADIYLRDALDILSTSPTHEKHEGVMVECQHLLARDANRLEGRPAKIAAFDDGGSFGFILRTYLQAIYEPSSSHKGFDKVPEGDLEKLDEATTKLEKAIETQIQGNAFQAITLCQLAEHHLARYEKTKNTDDLQRGLEPARKAAEISAAFDVLHAKPSRVLSHLLYTQFELESKEQSKFNRRRLRDLLGPDSTGQSKLDARINVLKTSIDYLEAALSATQHDEWRRQEYSIILINRLRDLFDLTRDGDAIVKALSYVDTPQLAASGLLASMAKAEIYSTVFGQTGEIKCLDQSLSMWDRVESMLQHTDFDDSKLAPCYHGISVAYGYKYSRFRDIEYLNKTVDFARKALGVMPTNSDDRAEYLVCLAEKLTTFYVTTKSEDALIEAYEHLGVAKSLMEDPSSPEVEYLITLGRLQYEHWRQKKDLEEVNSAIETFRQLTKELSPDHPYYGGNLFALALALGTRWDARQHDSGDLAEAFQRLIEAVHCTSMPPLDRVKSANASLSVMRSYINTGLLDSNVVELILRQADQISAEGLQLLAVACGRQLPRDDQQYAAQLASGLAANGCAISLKLSAVCEGSESRRYVEEALCRIEIGRGLILGNMIDQKEDLNHLKDKQPNLADEYEKLRQMAFGRNVGADKLREHLGSFSKLKECEQTIRQYQGFEHFQKPFTAAELRKCASEGPIVIVNVTEYDADAIIVTPHELKNLGLPEMLKNTPSSFGKSLQQMREISRGENEDAWRHAMIMNSTKTDDLEWLWRSCVQPILGHLGLLSVQEHAPRVWWIGTGAASSLPFHAAGDYRRAAQKGPDSSLPQTCLDCITPSYALTIKALQYARTQALQYTKAQATKVQATSTPLSLLLVTMPTTPGYSGLAGVAREKDAVEDAVGRSFKLKALEQPSSKEVLQHFKDFHIVHFACHGHSTLVDPSESHLVLQSTNASGSSVVDKLTVKSLLDSTGCSSPWVAYLSACSTAEVKAADLVAEGLHLASAFQVAGFPHVIGSLWAANDYTCANLAGEFYTELAKAKPEDHRDAAPRALRRAVIRIRGQGPPGSRYWVPFVHYGA